MDFASIREAGAHEKRANRHLARDGFAGHQVIDVDHSIAAVLADVSGDAAAGFAVAEAVRDELPLFWGYDRCPACVDDVSARTDRAADRFEGGAPAGCDLPADAPICEPGEH
jgi:hypothetical protein